MITQKIRFLLSLKYGRHCWCRLRGGKKVCKGFEIKDLGVYHDLQVETDTLLLAEFESFKNMCLKIYELDPAEFLLASGLAWKETFNKTKLKLDLLTDTYMLLVVENVLEEGLRQSNNQKSKANNKYMKDYEKNKKLLYIQY